MTGEPPKPALVTPKMYGLRGPGCAPYVLAIIGSLLIAIPLPVLLIVIRYFDEIRAEESLQIAEEIGVLLGTAFIICGPGVVLSSAILMKVVSQGAEYWSLRQTIFTGVLGGIILTFLNLPAYTLISAMSNDTYVMVRVAVLFAVSGGSSGLWVAWQAWRVWRPREPFFPRFRLATLLLVIVFWGTALLVFQTRPSPLKDVISR